MGSCSSLTGPGISLDSAVRLPDCLLQVRRTSRHRCQVSIWKGVSAVKEERERERRGKEKENSRESPQWDGRPRAAGTKLRVSSWIQLWRALLKSHVFPDCVVQRGKIPLIRLFSHSLCLSVILSPPHTASLSLRRFPFPHRSRSPPPRDPVTVTALHFPWFPPEW